MALEPVVADAGFVAGLNGAGAAFLSAAADSLAWTLQDAKVGPLALQFVHACAAAGAGIVLAGVGSSTPSKGSEIVKASPVLLSPTRSSVGPPDMSKFCFQKDFACLGRLGRGAFGEVWRCRDLADGKEYAVKAVRFRANDKDSELRAKREVEMLASVNHPNIMRYHRHWVEFDQDSGRGEFRSGCSSSATPAPAIAGMSTPAPMSSPTLKAAMLPIPMELSADESSCSYDGGSCGSAEVVFEATHCEEHVGEVIGSTLLASADGGEDTAGTEGHRRISSGWTSSCAAGAHVVGEAGGDPSGTISEDLATLFIQVELCREETLQSWITSRNSKVDEGRGDDRAANEAKHIFHQCACALAHLHERCSIHRDVKPSNILFAQDGSVRLGDFGLAKPLDRNSSPTPTSKATSEDARKIVPETEAGSRGQPTRIGCAVGTPSYASPEQRSGEPMGAASDVYSLGLVLMELICPMQTQMERAAVLQRLRDAREVPSRRCLRPKCQKLARLAVWMTEPEPSKRPTANDIINVVRQIRMESRRRFDFDGIAAAASTASAGAPTAKVARSVGVRSRCRHRQHCFPRSFNKQGASTLQYRETRAKHH